MHNCLKLHTPFSFHLTYYEKTYIEIVPELEVTQSWAQELRKRERERKFEFGEWEKSVTLSISTGIYLILI